MPKTTRLPSEYDHILAQEFSYIAQTATQANEDRARVSSFYLIAVGSLIATIFGTQFFDPNFFTPTVEFMFSAIFALLTLLGTSTIVQLARLRSAWHNSMLALNKIKDFAVSRNRKLADAFLWRTDTLPPKYKKDSISNYQAIEVSVISGLTFGAAILFLQFGLGMSSRVHWLASLAIGIVACFVQLEFYKRTLNK